MRRCLAVALALLAAVIGARAGSADEARELMQRIERHGDALYELTEATLAATQRWPPTGSAYELWIMVEAVERAGDRLERRYRDTRGFSGAGDLVDTFGRELGRVEELAPLVLPPGRALERVEALVDDHARLARLLEGERSGLRSRRPEPREVPFDARDLRRAREALSGLEALVDRLLPMMPDPPESPALPDSVGDGTVEALVDPEELPDPLREDTSDLFVEPGEALYVRRGVNAVFDELRIWLVLSMRLSEAELASLEDEELRARGARLLRVGRYVDRAMRRFEDDLPRPLVELWNETREPQARLARVLELPPPRR